MERLIKIGKIKPRKASEIKNSRIGIGFEKLDRKVFNPETVSYTHLHGAEVHT